MGISSFKQVSIVTIGAEARKTLPAKAKAYGCSKLALVTDQGMVVLGIADEIKNCLEAEGFTVIVYDKVEPDPTDTSCEIAAKFVLDNEVDGIIGLGGGSSLDTAKAVKLLSNNPLPLNQYYRRSDYKKGLPLFLLPTTAGTGSEGSNYSVINDTVSGNKLSLFVAADESICDPELTYKMPKSLTASTGVDALAHAAESLTSNKPNPHSHLLAERAIELIIKYLPIATENPTDAEARYNMMLAANFAGTAFSDTSTQLGHALGQSLSAKYHIAHGVTCSWFLPEAIRYSTRYKPDEVKIILKAMGVNFPKEASEEVLSQLVFNELMAFIKKLEFITPSQSGLSREQFVDIIDLVFTSGPIKFVPRIPTREEVAQMLGKIYDDFEALYL